MYLQEYSQGLQPPYGWKIMVFLVTILFVEYGRYVKVPKVISFIPDFKLR